MPLTISVPSHYRNDAPLVQQSDASVANVDLAPTILDLAHGQPCRTDSDCRVMDGRSLLPIMNGRGGFPDLAGAPARDLRLRLPRGPDRRRGLSRVRSWADTEHRRMRADRDRALRSRQRSSYQLENIYPAPRRSAEADRELELNRIMSRLSDCAGIKGRDPEPASGHYCE